MNHFQGRVSCKYGQTKDQGNCALPGDPTRKVTVPVDAQLEERTADKAVYCSCRCDGEDKNARYCKCPSGYACDHLVDDLHLGGGQLAGSYCVRDGTQYVSGKPPVKQCLPAGYPTIPAEKPTCGTNTDS